MPGATTAAAAREDHAGTVAEALAAFIAFAGVAGHVALGLAALTFLSGVLPPML